MTGTAVNTNIILALSRASNP